jgi:hypothetical protein
MPMPDPSLSKVSKVEAKQVDKKVESNSEKIYYQILTLKESISLGELKSTLKRSMGLPKKEIKKFFDNQISVSIKNGNPRLTMNLQQCNRHHHNHP